MQPIKLIAIDLDGTLLNTLDDLKNADYCSHYDAESLQTFYDKYGSLVHRMIDLSAFKK